MSNFDLIPTAYRKQMVTARAVVLILQIGAGVLLLLALIWAGLHLSIGGLNAQILVLQQRNDALNADKARFAQLEADTRAIKSQQAQLSTLAAGGEISALLLSLDRALLPDTIQLTELRLQRPDDSRIASGAAEAVIGLRGFARSHAALSAFVTQLLAQPAFTDMKLLRAERDDSGATAPLEFAIRGSTLATPAVAP